MPRKINLLLAFSAFLITMCKTYDQSGTVASANGLSCQNYTDYGSFIPKQGADCFYACPDGTVRQPTISGKFSAESTLYSASKGELDSQFCGMTSPPASTIAPVSTSPPLVLLTPSLTLTPTTQASPIPEISPTAQSPLLTGNITMCDQNVDLISFRMAEPAPDLTDKVLTVQISEQEISCAVNPVNTSLLTCTLPSRITFPARVLVSLDGAVVNDFIYDGIGCIIVDTPIPASGPTPTP
ncbi:MAG: hypothetical protein L0287_34845 [Anaerolineae bacterium]|nr:hypothetical protein [Anaerolineae bacterium]MCI0609548.1 hypothetical protein [Anaerolineae bacterium]